MTETQILERRFATCVKPDAGSVSSRIIERLCYLADEKGVEATNIPPKDPEFGYTVGLANGLRMAASVVEREFKAWF